MKRSIQIVCFAILVFGASGAGAVSFEWARIGNPGNPGDNEIHYDGRTGSGSVDYVYRISKHEVTNAQYVEFLNAVDPHGMNALGLFNPRMATGFQFGGIGFDPNNLDGSKYVVKPSQENKPVVYVSFFDAMRFVNWLDNGQGDGDTETGVYTVSDGVSELRSSNAEYFIPSADEWYKAAYHKNDGTTGNYWNYPTGSDIEPYSDNPDDSDSPNIDNSANFFKNDFIANGYDEGYAVSASSDRQSVLGLTDVGAYDQSAGPYGTFDQGGNIEEWNEGMIPLSANAYPAGYIPGRGVLGGSWTSDSSRLLAYGVGAGTPNLETGYLGFRVASIPEPCTLTFVTTTVMWPLARKSRILQSPAR